MNAVKADIHCMYGVINFCGITSQLCEMLSMIIPCSNHVTSHARSVRTVKEEHSLCRVTKLSWDMHMNCLLYIP